MDTETIKLLLRNKLDLFKTIQGQSRAIAHYRAENKKLRKMQQQMNTVLIDLNKAYKELINAP